MLVCRTDLAVEAAQLLREQGEAAGRLEEYRAFMKERLA